MRCCMRSNSTELRRVRTEETDILMTISYCKKCFGGLLLLIFFLRVKLFEVVPQIYQSQFRQLDVSSY